MSEIESFHLEIITTVPVLKDKIEVIANRFNVDPSQLLIELIKYLVITNESEKITSPSYLVDLVWHEFILCTKYYHQFCTEKFGKFIHHTPDSKPNKTNFSSTLEQYKNRIPQWKKLKKRVDTGFSMKAVRRGGLLFRDRKFKESIASFTTALKFCPPVFTKKVFWTFIWTAIIKQAQKI